MNPTSKGNSTLPADFPCTLDQLHDSPIYKHLGIRVLEVTERAASVLLVSAEHHKNLQGVYHGGAIAAAVDSAAALAAMASVGPTRTVSSIDLKLNFLAPITSGDLKASARVLHSGKRTVVCEVDAIHGTKLAAKALATYAVLDAGAIERVTKHAGA